jgi:hypothetical protein
MSRLDLDGRIVGSVAGSGGRVYSVDATLAGGADGRLSNVDGHCSCPIGYNCKHVTAVLLDVAQTPVDVIQKPATSQDPNRVRTNVKVNLPGSVMTWLDRLSVTDKYSRTPMAPKPSSDQIFFVFRRSYRGSAEIAPYKAYVKKDGSIGKNTQEYNGHHSELCLNLGDAHHQAARFSVSLVTSTPSLNLIPSITFGN